MFHSVLIANRGEIACRIMRTAKRLGMRTIGVHSPADAQALHVRLADEAHAIGTTPASDSYLSIEAILAAARATGAQCIHPGYGFLSENADFSRACAGAGIAFVGPPADAILAMGLKDGAKALMQKAGVPVVPGYHGPRQERQFLREKAYEIGYPVLIKAVAGGGGKGMRRVDAHAEFEAALDAAQREALASFGNARVLIEKYVARPRHIEMQVMADAHGNVVHLFERDCSLQRRHQKVIEEAPAPGMTPALREAMGKAAVEAARAVGYRGAGTVEFIVDGAKGLRPEAFFFMEMNTRLQVEHPVTEMITGLDLVELQFRVAAGEPLPVAQSDLRIRGHAVEARLYAEDPETGFLPSTGKLWALRLPEFEDVRIDSGFEEGDEVSPFYDPMLAKVIAHGETRAQALNHLVAALGHTFVAGPKCNIAFLKALAGSAEFRAEKFDTGFIDRHAARLGAAPQKRDDEAVRLGVVKLLAARHREAAREPRSPWDALDGFQLGERRSLALPLVVEGERAVARLSWPAPGPVQAGPDVAVEFNGRATRYLDVAETLGGESVIETPEGVLVLRHGRQTSVGLFDPLADGAASAGGGDGTVKAPMHGRLVALLVAPGDRVEIGQRLAVVEAMKMEHPLAAPIAGIVEDVAVEDGAQIAQGARILTIEPE
jgi:3-methylcrotonyl-CoA carboxylase alpha subunit